MNDTTNKYTDQKFYEKHLRLRSKYHTSDVDMKHFSYTIVTLLIFY